MLSKKVKSKESIRELARYQPFHRVHIALANEFDSELKPFCLGVANMVKESQAIQSSHSVQYLDFCTFCHLTNKDLFILELCPKYLNFIIARSQILQIENIEKVAISLPDKSLFELRVVAYTLSYNINPIFLSQFRNNNV